MKNNKLALISIFASFLVMGFVDIVGIATNFVKKDFELSDTVAGFLPSMIFLWFLICSLPTGLLMNRIGRKNTVLLSIGLTGIAMLLPMLVYTKVVVFAAFALLGIGNTIIQVSLNPLLSNVVSQEKVSSSISLGQFTKSIASFLGPILVSSMVAWTGNWKYVFLAYAISSFLVFILLASASVEREAASGTALSFFDCLALLKDGRIFALFVGVVMLVGFDVGINVRIPAHLQQVCGMSLEKAGLGSSVYFLGKTLGAFAGAFALARLNAAWVGRVSALMMFLSIAALLMTTSATVVLVCIFVSSLGVAAVFSLLFGWAFEHLPSKTNEASSLLVMGVSGGALIPPIIGFMTTRFGTVGAISVLLVTIAYAVVLMMTYRKKAV
jgi:FHS family L-fucose permease-like MFS transporter